MDLQTLFKRAVLLLETKKTRFALAGGLATSLYRAQERATKDIDFLIFVSTGALQAAEEIVKELELHPGVARQADLEGGPMFAIKKKNTPPWMVVGRKPGNALEIGVDFILPGMPWFGSALARAQQNRIDFGFGEIPCLTAEDVVISKLHALKNNSRRFKDLDDLQSIFQSRTPLDLPYLGAEMKRLKLPLPALIRADAPSELQRISKKIR